MNNETDFRQEYDAQYYKVRDFLWRHYEDLLSEGAFAHIFEKAFEKGFDKFRKYRQEKFSAASRKAFIKLIVKQQFGEINKTYVERTTIGGREIGDIKEPEVDRTLVDLELFIYTELCHLGLFTRDGIESSQKLQNSARKFYKHVHPLIEVRHWFGERKILSARERYLDSQVNNEFRVNEIIDDQPDEIVQLKNWLGS